MAFSICQRTGSHNQLEPYIEQTLSGLDTHDVKELQVRGEQIRHLNLNAEIPRELREPILAAYLQLCEESGGQLDVAVRSSATSEDLPDASFAGQQETYLNVKGEQELITNVRRSIASLFTDRAISYRTDKGSAATKIALSVGMQRMVRADLGCSGVMFFIHT